MFVPGSAGEKTGVSANPAVSIPSAFVGVCLVRFGSNAWLTAENRPIRGFGPSPPERHVVEARGVVVDGFLVPELGMQ